MAVASTSSEGYVIATATGNSDSLAHLRPGTDYILSFSSSGAFLLDVQVGPDWADAYDASDTKAAIDSSTGKQHVRVPGGSQYRMSVDTYNNPITMTAREAS